MKRHTDSDVQHPSESGLNAAGREPLQPTSPEFLDFTLRRWEAKDDRQRRPSNFDDAWIWFLSLFSEQRRNDDDSGDPPLRRAA